jgi:class 3 adenylate cyclase
MAFSQPILIAAERTGRKRGRSAACVRVRPGSPGQGQLTGWRRIVARNWKDRNDGVADAAAQTALAALQSAPLEIRQYISIDIALHYGVAAYGNIGSGNRLDFSVVGRDVNILSRLELLCKDVGRPLLMTDAFAVEVAEPVFRQHQAVYGMCQEGEAPCSPKRLAGEIH